MPRRPFCRRRGQPRYTCSPSAPNCFRSALRSKLDSMYQTSTRRVAGSLQLRKDPIRPPRPASWTCPLEVLLRLDRQPRGRPEASARSIRWAEQESTCQEPFAPLSFPNLHAVLLAEMDQGNLFEGIAPEMVQVRGHDSADLVVADRMQHRCVSGQARHSRPGAEIHQSDYGDRAETGYQQIDAGDLVTEYDGWLDVGVANSAAVIRQESFGGLAVRLRRD